MKIVQIADLHISSTTNIGHCKKSYLRIWNSLKKHLDKEETLVFCICGDIFDHGDFSQSSKVSEMLDYFRSLMKDYKVRFLSIPGNHDLYDKTVVDKYCELLSDHCPESSELAKCNATAVNIDGICFILCNSSINGIDYGQVDIDCIEECCKTVSCPKILVVHHTILSENETDPSNIRNAYRLLEIIGNDSIAILHGHTHGYKNILIGDACRVIGVGPLFKDIAGVAHQINLIDVTPAGVNTIINFRDQEDIEDCIEIVLYTSASTTYYDYSCKGLYKKIVADTVEKERIMNLHAILKMDYLQFSDEIRGEFCDDLVVAEEWQRETPPQDLYYNHGQYIFNEGCPGTNYIISELKKKSSSNRAIIPLINLNMVLKSGDGFLPSFDSVQFGFRNEDRTELVITLYMRALEVMHFLRVNLCELFLLSERVKLEIRSIKKIEIHIFAFSAQCRVKFGCFRKAELDKKNSAQFVLMLEGEDFSEILKMMEQKRDFNETVTIDQGFLEFQTALKAVIERKGEHRIARMLLEKVNSIILSQNNLKRTRSMTSDGTATTRDERKLEESISALIDVLKKEIDS